MNLATLLSRKKQNTATKVVLSGVKCGLEDSTFGLEIKKNNFFYYHENKCVRKETTNKFFTSEV